LAVTVSFTLTRGDLLRGSWLSIRSHPFVLTQGIVIFLVLPWALSVWQVVLAARRAAYVSTFKIVEMALIPPLAVVGFAAITLWISRGSRTIGGHYKFEFTDEEIHVTGPGIDSHIEWSALTKCFGIRSGVIFYSGNQPMIAIPGRALTAQAVEELHAMSAAKGLRIVGVWRATPAT